MRFFLHKPLRIFLITILFLIIALVMRDPLTAHAADYCDSDPEHGYSQSVPWNTIRVCKGENMSGPCKDISGSVSNLGAVTGCGTTFNGFRSVMIGPGPGQGISFWTTAGNQTGTTWGVGWDVRYDHMQWSPVGWNTQSIDFHDQPIPTAIPLAAPTAVPTAAPPAPQGAPPQTASINLTYHPGSADICTRTTDVNGLGIVTCSGNPTPLFTWDPVPSGCGYWWRLENSIGVLVNGVISGPPVTTTSANPGTNPPLPPGQYNLFVITHGCNNAPDSAPRFGGLLIIQSTTNNPDTDRNGCVGIADYNIWRARYVTGLLRQGTFPDINADGTVDLKDYNYWFNAMVTLPSDKICS